jgi:hypothetical protein
VYIWEKSMTRMWKVGGKSKKQIDAIFCSVCLCLIRCPKWSHFSCLHPAHTRLQLFFLPSRIGYI